MREISNIRLKMGKITKKIQKIEIEGGEEGKLGMKEGFIAMVGPTIPLLCTASINGREKLNSFSSEIENR